MFTGLVADIGTIQSRERSGADWRLVVRTGFDVDTLELGESIAVDGACLTVTDVGADTFTIEASPETLRRTTLGERSVGDRVHLERALRVGDRLGGHMVLGHVDAVGTLVSKRREQNAWVMQFDAPEAVNRYMIEKGSITVDGVSLTVNEVDGARFTVAIIPHTAEHTHLVDHPVGRQVNLEADVIGKYVEKFCAPHRDGVTREMLDEMGF